MADQDTEALDRYAQRLVRFFPFRPTEEELRPIYLSLLRYAREGRAPERDGERAAALIFKELGFFEPVMGLEPVSEAKRRRCTESKLFMALSTR